jgi:hypothetical protein
MVFMAGDPDQADNEYGEEQKASESAASAVHWNLRGELVLDSCDERKKINSDGELAAAFD